MHVVQLGGVLCIATLLSDRLFVYVRLLKHRGHIGRSGVETRGSGGSVNGEPRATKGRARDDTERKRLTGLEVLTFIYRHLQGNLTSSGLQFQWRTGRQRR